MGKIGLLKKWMSYIKGLKLEFYLSMRWGKQGIAQECKDNRLKPTEAMDGQQKTCSLLGLVVDVYGWDLN